MNHATGHTNQLYRGLVLDLFVFPATVPARRPEWDYEVAVEDEEGARLCGPYFSISGYGTRCAAEDASLQRARIAADALLGDI